MNTLDLICLVPLALALFNGFRKGLIIEVTTLVAFVIAIIACMKLTHFVVAFLQPIAGHSKWLPFVAYLITFILAYLLVLWIGKLLEKVVQIIQLGLVNRILGMIFSLLKMCFFISLVLWLADQVHIITEDTHKHSICYGALRNFAPATVTFISDHLPFLKGELAQIEHFFDSLH